MRGGEKTRWSGGGGNGGGSRAAAERIVAWMRPRYRRKLGSRTPWWLEVNSKPARYVEYLRTGSQTRRADLKFGHHTTFQSGRGISWKERIL